MTNMDKLNKYLNDKSFTKSMLQYYYIEYERTINDNYYKPTCEYGGEYIGNVFVSFGDLNEILCDFVYGMIPRCECNDYDKLMNHLIDFNRNFIKSHSNEIIFKHKRKLVKHKLNTINHDFN